MLPLFWHYLLDLLADTDFTLGNHWLQSYTLLPLFWVGKSLLFWHSMPYFWGLIF